MLALGIRYRQEGEPLLLQGLDGCRFDHLGSAGTTDIPQEQHIGHLYAGASADAAAAAGLAAPVGSNALLQNVSATCSSDMASSKVCHASAS
mgnify:FL=1